MSRAACLKSTLQVGAVAGFARSTHIPSFFVAFIVTPFASNASELVSSLKFAMAKKRRNISLTFCQARALTCAMCAHPRASSSPHRPHPRRCTARSR